MQTITEDQILKHSEELYKQPKINGLYFLINSKEIVYVGSGHDVYKRIEVHRIAPLLKFTKYYILRSDLKGKDLQGLEKEYIRKLKPAYNKISNPDYRDNLKPLWFKYISQKRNIRTIMDISRKLGINFHIVMGVVKGTRKKKDQHYQAVSEYINSNF